MLFKRCIWNRCIWKDNTFDNSIVSVFVKHMSCRCSWFWLTSKTGWQSATVTPALYRGMQINGLKEGCATTNRTCSLRVKLPSIFCNYNSQVKAISKKFMEMYPIKKKKLCGDFKTAVQLTFILFHFYGLIAVPFNIST